MSLTALLRKGPLRQGATATPATAATDNQTRTTEGSTTVARVATVAVACGVEPAANESAPAFTPVAKAKTVVEADSWCWPHSTAMNTGEIVAFTSRTMLFMRRGIEASKADDLAESLMLRDRQADDRRLCLECSHLTGRSPSIWRCRSSQLAGVMPELASDLVTIRQRCPGFNDELIHI